MEKNEKVSKLRDFFEQQGITQEEVARLLGVHKTYINQLLTGKKQFGKGVAKKWSDLFGLSYTWLLTGEGDMLVGGNVASVDGDNNITVGGDASNITNNSDKALIITLGELSEMRKLLAEAIAINKEQSQRFLGVIENLTSK